VFRKRIKEGRKFLVKFGLETGIFSLIEIKAEFSVGRKRKLFLAEMLKESGKRTPLR
jgi:hypothetical protein